MTHTVEVVVGVAYMLTWTNHRSAGVATWLLSTNQGIYCSTVLISLLCRLHYMYLWLNAQKAQLSQTECMTRYVSWSIIKYCTAIRKIPFEIPAIGATAVGCKSKGKGFPYSLQSVGPVADPGVQAVSPHVTISHPPGGRLPLLSPRPAVTFPAAEHHRPLAGTKLYCMVTEAHRCEQLAQGCYTSFAPSRI